MKVLYIFSIFVIVMFVKSVECTIDMEEDGTYQDDLGGLDIKYMFDFDKERYSNNYIRMENFEANKQKALKIMRTIKYKSVNDFDPCNWKTNMFLYHFARDEFYEFWVSKYPVHSFSPLGTFQFVPEINKFSENLILFHNLYCILKL